MMITNATTIGHRTPFPYCSHHSPNWWQCARNSYCPYPYRRYCVAKHTSPNTWQNNFVRIQSQHCGKFYWKEPSATKTIGYCKLYSHRQFINTCKTYWLSLTHTRIIQQISFVRNVMINIYVCPVLFIRIYLLKPKWVLSKFWYNMCILILTLYIYLFLNIILSPFS